MKKLFVLLFVFACGSGSDDPLERPSGSPPEETPPETLEIEIDGETVEMGTRNLYDSKNIEVFYTSPVPVSDDLEFVEVLSNCVYGSVRAGHNPDKVGLLNGIGKEQGYTKDFLLNPDVERTWSGSNGLTHEIIIDWLDLEFERPLHDTSPCIDSDGNKVPCKSFMCGVDKTPEPVEETGPPEEFEFVKNKRTIKVSAKNLYNAEKIEIYYSSRYPIVDTTSFKSVLDVCLTFSELYGYNIYDKIGVLNGIGIEDGYTKDFLLNPDVDRTWVYGTEDSDDLEAYVDAEFTDPLANNAVCNNDTPCKKIMCGIVKG